MATAEPQLLSSRMDCPAEVADYFNYAPLQVLHWTHLAFSVVGIILVVYTIIGHLHKSWFEGVFKETIYVLYFFILWHSLFTIIFSAIHIFAWITSITPCEMLIDMRFCVLRIIITLSFPSFVFIHAAVTLQRVITSFSGSKLFHVIVSRCFIVLIFAQCFAYLFLGFRGYSLEGRTPLCSGYVKGKEEHLLFGTFIMMSIDVINVIIAFLLMIYNRWKSRQLSSASLETKFRCRQTLQSIQQTLPSTFFHLLCFTAQYFGFELSFSQPLGDVQQQTLTGFLYMMPYYCCICPALLLWLTIRQERIKQKHLERISTVVLAGASAESHFTQLLKQWEANRPSTSPKEHKKTTSYRATRETTD